MPVDLAVRHRTRRDRPQEVIEEVRDLGRRGLLSATLAAAAGGERRRLIGGAYLVAMPVVFSRLTQKMERRRGHPACANSIRQLAAECLDRFEDDMEAVVEDIERRATLPIRDLEAWIASWVNKAAIDGYRRRRGAVGALQRPRLPRWLASALGRDRWLSELAVRMLTWAGNPGTAGCQVWPTESWQVCRTEYRGNGPDGGVGADIAVVLDAMRTNPNWFASYVETPLGHKQTPVARMLEDENGHPIEHSALSLVDREEQDDAQLRMMAYQAFEAIQMCIRHGEPARQVIADVVGKLFGDHDVGTHDGEHLLALLDDPTELDRIVVDVLTLIEEPGTLPA